MILRAPSIVDLLIIVLSERIEKFRFILVNSGFEQLDILQSLSIKLSFIPNVYFMAFTSNLIDIIFIISCRVDAVVQSGVISRVCDRRACWLRVLAL